MSDMLTQTLILISLLWFYFLTKTNKTCLPLQVWYTNMNIVFLPTDNRMS
jgi:hypothetical protein